MPLRLAFLGTPAFAARILAALLASPHQVAAVYCQPPRPAGRGHRQTPSAVQRAAEAAGFAPRMPERLGETEAAAFAALGLDTAVVASYGLILPRAMIEAPRFGCLNVHASLLPRWRGAAPIERAILAGDAATGVTIMRMDEGLDTGPILLAETIPIAPRTTAAELYDGIAERGAALLLAALDGLEAGRLAPRPQPAEGATYAKKLARDEGRLDWRGDAAALERAVRALNPAPGTWFEWRGERIRVLAAALAPDGRDAAPGTVLDDALAVACGTGALRLLVLQRPGRAPVDAAAFLRGFPLPRGTVLPCPATS
ncbi:MAG TPA: methionyl-tRNA formyltransferase [Stellaceae bacterium]|nr:methionyl-tRNA formyltransferase [Stellaceae bacterium]